MVLKKLLASVGIGNTTVDTALKNSILKPGEFLQGVVNLRGGSIDQTIDRIDLVLECVVDREVGDGKTQQIIRVAQHNLLERFSIPAGALREIPFEMKVPVDTPINFAHGYDLRVPLYVRTEIHVAGAMNPSDRDRVQVMPNRAQEKILEAMGRLSFRLYKADLEYGSVRGARLPFYQEIEFYAGPNFERHINEVELTFVTRERDMDVILEVDKKSKGWARLAYDSIDEVRGFTVRYDDVDRHDWTRTIENILLR